MAKVLACVTGTVLDVETRSGVSKAGNDYSIKTASVIVCNRAILMVTLTDDAPVPAIGAEVDYLVDLSVFRTDVQARLVSDYPTPASRRSAPAA